MKQTFSKQNKDYRFFTFLAEHFKLTIYINTKILSLGLKIKICLM